MTQLLLVGHGKMGRMVEALAPEYGFAVAGVVDPAAGSDDVESPRWDGVDVAIDFSTADAVRVNAPALARRGINLVVGTTGWSAHEAGLRHVIETAGTAIVAAPNFSVGVVLFEAVVSAAARMFAAQPDFGAFIHETHHAAKTDAPSGTALLLQRTMAAAGFDRPIDVSSSRVGFVPGTHVVGFDGPAETIALTHAARDRTAFARGALTAARWVGGRRGWFTMKDVLGVQS
jgi:4-hydroxy-tetrahydrodipicolinate reductase